jgi:hypothetical protein
MKLRECTSRDYAFHCDVLVAEVIRSQIRLIAVKYLMLRQQAMLWPPNSRTPAIYIHVTQHFKLQPPLEYIKSPHHILFTPKVPSPAYVFYIAPPTCSPTPPYGAHHHLNMPRKPSTKPSTRYLGNAGCRQPTISTTKGARTTTPVSPPKTH